MNLGPRAAEQHPRLVKYVVVTAVVAGVVVHGPLREFRGDLETQSKEMKIIQGGAPEAHPQHSNAGNQTRPPGSRNRYHVLFLSAENALCSLMAEALLRRTGGDDFRAFSAGIEPKGEIDPLAIDFLKGHRVWHHGLRSKSYQEFLLPSTPPMNFVISVGARPPAGLPATWPGQPKVIHWRITEPVMDGSPAQQANSLRKTFTELETRIRLFVLVYQKEALRNAPTAA